MYKSHWPIPMVFIMLGIAPKGVENPMFPSPQSAEKCFSPPECPGGIEAPFPENEHFSRPPKGGDIPSVSIFNML